MGLRFRSLSSSGLSVQPMLPVEHNGDGFHYVVSYTRRDPYHPAGTHLAVERRVWDWRQGQLVVNELEEYSEYLVSESKLLARWQQRVWYWRQGQLVVNELEEYSEYVVAVRAANSVGPAPRSTVEQRIGHSSENGTLLYIE